MAVFAYPDASTDGRGAMFILHEQLRKMECTGRRPMRHLFCLLNEKVCGERTEKEKERDTSFNKTALGLETKDTTQQPACVSPHSCIRQLMGTPHSSKTRAQREDECMALRDCTQLLNYSTTHGTHEEKREGLGKRCIDHGDAQLTRMNESCVDSSSAASLTVSQYIDR